MRDLLQEIFGKAALIPAKHPMQNVAVGAVEGGIPRGSSSQRDYAGRDSTTSLGSKLYRRAYGQKANIHPACRRRFLQVLLMFYNRCVAELR